MPDTTLPRQKLKPLTIEHRINIPSGRRAPTIYIPGWSFSQNPKANIQLSRYPQDKAALLFRCPVGSCFSRLPLR
jgi:hypothetical protein